MSNLNIDLVDYFELLLYICEWVSKKYYLSNGYKDLVVGFLFSFKNFLHLAFSSCFSLEDVLLTL